MLYKQLQFTTGWFGRLMFKFDSKIDIRFDDVIGYDAQKIKLRQIIKKVSQKALSLKALKEQEKLLWQKYLLVKHKCHI